MTSATQELRRLLDERGVEWHGGDAVTYWADADALESVFRDGALDISRYGVAPAQAVEATLGRGTCRIELIDMDYRCSACDGVVGTIDSMSELYIDGNAIDTWNFCPNCGLEVER